MALKTIDDEERRKILDAFPMLLSEDTWASPLLTYRAVSVWDHWLFQSGQNDLDEATAEDKERWLTMFQSLDSFVFSNTNVLFVDWSTESQVTLSTEDDVNLALKQLDPARLDRMILLLIPELKLSYASGDGDPHTT